MVVTRAQLKSLSQDELIDRLFSVEKISQQMTDVINQFDKLISKFEELPSELAVFFFFFLNEICSMQGSTATMRHGVTRKEA